MCTCFFSTYRENYNFHNNAKELPYIRIPIIKVTVGIKNNSSVNLCKNAVLSCCCSFCFQRVSKKHKCFGFVYESPQVCLKGVTYTNEAVLDETFWPKSIPCIHTWAFLCKYLNMKIPLQTSGFKVCELILLLIQRDLIFQTTSK